MPTKKTPNPDRLSEYVSLRITVDDAVSVYVLHGKLDPSVVHEARTWNVERRAKMLADASPAALKPDLATEMAAIYKAIRKLPSRRDTGAEKEITKRLGAVLRRWDSDRREAAGPSR